MPFMKGLAPIRRTVKYLEAGRLILKDNVRIFSVNYNILGNNHVGAKDFVFWHLAQVQYKNPSVQVITFKDMTPSPFVRCYFSDGNHMLIDIDDKPKDQIMEHLIRVVGKSEETLASETITQEKKDNPANFGYGCERPCICDVLGQVPCSGVVLLPKFMRGKYRLQDN